VMKASTQKRAKKKVPPRCQQGRPGQQNQRLTSPEHSITFRLLSAVVINETGSSDDSAKQNLISWTLSFSSIRELLG